MAWIPKTNKFICAGMSTASPMDFKGEAKKYNALINVRVRGLGEIVPRPGLVKFNTSSSPGATIEVIKKFGYFSGDQIIVVHSGSNVGIMGESMPWTVLSSGGWEGGESASIVLWRPSKQGEKWAYVYSLGKQVKFPRTATSSSDVQQIGISPPGKSDTTPFDITPSDPPTVAQGTSTPGPTGLYQYAYRYRNSITGVVSDISDLSTEITVTNTEIDLSVLLPSADPQVDTLDIYRIGGTLEDLTYVDSIANGITIYTDALTDADIVINDSIPANTNTKPWVTTDELGVTTGGNPLPYVWGPFHGYLMAAGAPTQPGTLFWTNPNDPDAMDPDNYIEITGANEPLLRGFIYDSRSFVFTNDGLYIIIPEVTGLNTFRYERTSCSRGALSSDLIAVGDRIYFVAEDGIFATRGGEEISLSNDIYNMFSHEGATGESPDSIESMSLPEFRRGLVNPSYTSLTYDSGFLRFHFKNKNGNTSMLVYDFIMEGWVFDDYLGKDITTVYGMEGEVKIDNRNFGANEVLVGTDAGQIYRMSAGSDDDGQAIQAGLVTHYEDFGNSRPNKRIGDIELDYDPQGIAITLTPRFNDGNTIISGTALPSVSGRQTKIVDLNSGHGRIAKNVAIALSWTIDSVDNARKGPKLFEWNISAEPKPEDTEARAIEWHSISDKVSEGYVYGVQLHIDTQGQDVGFNVWADQSDTGVAFTANSGAAPVVSPGASEQKLEFTWTGAHFFAQLLKLVPTSNTDLIRITDWKWLYYEDPPKLKGTDTNWTKPLGECETGYVTGVRVEFDSFNVGKAFIFQGEYDGTVTNYTAREGNSETHNGRKTAYFTFDEPFRANLVRMYTADEVLHQFYGICWYAHPEPPKLSNWDETFKDFGGPQVLKGVEFFVDTFGQDKTVEVQLDGITVETVTVNSNTRRRITVPISRDNNGEYPRAVTARLFPTDSNPAILYRYRWISQGEPEQVSNFNPTWTEANDPGAKFLQGARVLFDTQGQDKSVVVDIDGGDTLGPFTLNSSIRNTTILTFDPPVITHSMRLRSTDADEGFLYNVDWIWEPHPDLASLWQTQSTTFDLSGWMHIRRGFLAVSDGSGTITLRMILEDGTVIDKIFTAPGTGVYKKYEWFAPANKFKAVSFRVFSNTGFRLYQKDTEVFAKQWGSDEAYQIIRPFGDEHRRIGATI